MKKLIGITLVTMFLSASVFGQDTSGLQRISYKQSLAVDNNSTFEQQVPAGPYVLPNHGIQIFPGETIFIEISLNNSDIVGFKAVRKIADPKHTLVLSLKQVSEKGIHKQMMLTVFNPFEKELTYRAVMSTLRNKNWTETDVWPVQPKLSGIEMWPDLILSLGLSDWRFEN